MAMAMSRLGVMVLMVMTLVLAACTSATTPAR